LTVKLFRGRYTSIVVDRIETSGKGKMLLSPRATFAGRGVYVLGALLGASDEIQIRRSSIDAAFK